MMIIRVAKILKDIEMMSDGLVMTKKDQEITKRNTETTGKKKNSVEKIIEAKEAIIKIESMGKKTEYFIKFFLLL